MTKTELLDRISRGSAFNNGDITKSGGFFNHMEVANIFIETMKVHSNLKIIFQRKIQFLMT